MHRRKIKIKKVEEEKARRVLFSKLLKELINEANELFTEFGAEVGVWGISPDGKPFSFGFPSADAVMGRYLKGNKGNL